MRKATVDDLPAVCDIFKGAKASLAAAGVDQWQRGYPNADSVSADIVEGIGYVIERAGTVCGYMMLQRGEEEAYRNLFDGRWLTGENGSYMTVHRIAVAPRQKQRGIAQSMIKDAEKMAREHRCLSLRVDTHEDNRPMQRFLEKQGFEFCGKIALLLGPEAGNLRVCYEKLL